MIPSVDDEQLDDDGVLRLGAELEADILAVWAPFWRFKPRIEERRPLVDVMLAPTATRCFICFARLSGKLALAASTAPGVWSCLNLRACLHRRDERVKRVALRRFELLLGEVALPPGERVERLRKGILS